MRRALELAAVAEEAGSAGSEAQDKQVGEHRGRINACSKPGGPHDAEAGPAVEDFQPQERKDPQLHPEQALARKQQRGQWVSLNAPVVQEEVGCHDVGTVQEPEDNQGGQGHGADADRQGARELRTPGRHYPIRWLCDTPRNAGSQDGTRDRRLP
jgi:hypothetical protein